jgi:hypothetical protein
MPGSSGAEAEIDNGNGGEVYGGEQWWTAVVATRR